VSDFDGVKSDFEPQLVLGVLDKVVTTWRLSAT